MNSKIALIALIAVFSLVLLSGCTQAPSGEAKIPTAKQGPFGVEAVCPNASCEAGENCEICPQDCGCKNGRLCCNAKCALPACTTDASCADSDYRTLDFCVGGNTCNAACGHRFGFDNWYNVGEQVSALRGMGSYTSKTLIIKFESISSDGNAYAATFKLLNQAGSIIDTQTVRNGTSLDLVFSDANGSSVLYTPVKVFSIYTNQDGNLMRGWAELDIRKELDVGETIYGLAGQKSLSGKALSLRLDGIALGNTVYNGIFKLFDENTLIDTQVVPAGTFLNNVFMDQNGNKILKTVVQFSSWIDLNCVNCAPKVANLDIRYVADVGDKISGLRGDNSSAGLLEQVKLTAITQTGGTASYNATFELWNKEGTNKIDTQTVPVGTYLTQVFADANGSTALASVLKVKDIKAFVDGNGIVDGSVQIEFE